MLQFRPRAELAARHRAIAEALPGLLGPLITLVGDYDPDAGGAGIHLRNLVVDGWPPPDTPLDQLDGVGLCCLSFGSRRRTWYMMMFTDGVMVIKGFDISVVEFCSLEFGFTRDEVWDFMCGAPLPALEAGISPFVDASYIARLTAAMRRGYRIRFLKYVAALECACIARARRPTLGQI